MTIKKIKTIQIYSNGSINFVYKTLNFNQLIKMFEKDHKNFYLNKKKIQNNHFNSKIATNYKKSFF